MHRRGFLRSSGSSMAAFAPWPWAFHHKPAAPPPKGVTLLGQPQPFSYADLKGLAHTMGVAPYRESYKPLPAALQHLSWDQWESIVCKPDRALWYGEDLLFRIRFDHLGFSFSKPVRLHIVENGQAREILFDPGLFDYGRSGLKPEDLPKDLGFAGFNVLFHTDWASDRAVFQGASYFRAVDGDGQYGMSQRGLAIDTGMSTPEEFPDFVAFYLEKPAKGSSHAHRVRAARLSERCGRISIHHRRRQHAGDGYRCGALSRARRSNASASHPAPACSWSERTIIAWPTTGGRRSTIPTGCR